MKLRNKKTGEIVELLAKPSFVKRNEDFLQSEVNTFDSLAKLNEEWEDYEEDELLYIVSAEHRSGYQCVLKEDYPEICKVAKEIGIGFETEKECKKAVEKLKAWKRLKDKGFKLEIVTIGHRKYLEPTAEDDKTFDEAKELIKDFELIFGGEE